MYPVFPVKSERLNEIAAKSPGLNKKAPARPEPEAQFIAHPTDRNIPAGKESAKNDMYFSCCKYL